MSVSAILIRRVSLGGVAEFLGVVSTFHQVPPLRCQPVEFRECVDLSLLACDHTFFPAPEFFKQTERLERNGLVQPVAYSFFSYCRNVGVPTRSNPMS